MPAEKLATPTTTDNSLCPSIKWYKNSNFCFVFRGTCLKIKKKNKKNATYTPSNRFFFYVYKLNTWSQDLNSDFTLKECLFEGVKLAKNVNPGKYV